MNSRTKRKLRVLADPETKLSEKGKARLAGLNEMKAGKLESWKAGKLESWKAGKLVRPKQKKYYDRLVGLPRNPKIELFSAVQDLYAVDLQRRLKS